MMKRLIKVVPLGRLVWNRLSDGVG
jgi:hypothetical protein